MSYILEYLEGNIPLSIFVIIVLLLSFVQITPIKFYPWTAIKNYFTAPMRTEACLNSIKSDLDTLKNDIEKDKAIQARIRILSFGESLIRKGTSTKERFDQIMDDIDTYEQYCMDHPDFKNNKTVLTTKYISDKYYKCMNHEEEFLEING